MDIYFPSCFANSCNLIRRPLPDPPNIGIVVCRGYKLMIDWFKNNLNVDKRHSFYVTFSYHLQSSKQKVKEVLITVTCVEKNG